MNKKQLEIFLSKLKVFSRPQMKLEQYPTDGRNASEILWFAFQKGDIEHKVVADLGCGTGILGIGALLLGAKKVYFIDKSESAIEIAKENLHFAEHEMNISLSDRTLFLIGEIENFNTKVSTVIENPPFGTKTEHIDMIFLKKAINIARVVYSIHKTSTLPFLRKFAKKEKGEITNEIHLSLELKKTMQFHEKEIERVDAVCMRIESFLSRPQ